MTTIYLTTGKSSLFHGCWCGRGFSMRTWDTGCPSPHLITYYPLAPWWSPFINFCHKWRFPSRGIFACHLIRRRKNRFFFFLFAFDVISFHLSPFFWHWQPNCEWLWLVAKGLHVVNVGGRKREGAREARQKRPEYLFFVLIKTNFSPAPPSTVKMSPRQLWFSECSKTLCTQWSPLLVSFSFLFFAI